MWEETCMQALMIHLSTALSNFKTGNLNGEFNLFKILEGCFIYILCN
jgi:hypothetical protein